MAVADNKLVMVSYNTTEDDLENRKAQIESSIRSVQIKISSSHCFKVGLYA